MNNKQLDAFLQQAWYDPEEKAPEEKVVFRIQFKKIGSLGDFILFSGRPKSGKTKYLSGFISAAVSRTEVFSMAVRLPEGKREVVHFDTEQSKFSHYKMMQLILQLMGQKQFPANFKSYRCRAFSGSNIIAIIEHYLKLNPQTGIICLDGLLDTIENLNDSKNSSHLKMWLKRITEQYDVLLAGVIHRGFANDKSIGHIGSDGERAAQSVLMIEKNRELKQYVLKPEYLRDDDEFEPVAIYYNTQLSLWQQTDYMNEPETVKRGIRNRLPHEYDIQEHEDNVRRIFSTNYVQGYDEVIRNIYEQYAIGISNSKKMLNYLKDEVYLIFKTETGYTNVKQARLYVRAT